MKLILLVPGMVLLCGCGAGELANRGPTSHKEQPTPAAGHVFAERAATRSWQFRQGLHATEGVDVNALRELIARAQRSNTDVLLVSRHGRLIGRWAESDVAGKPIETMSVTKSIVSIAIGTLLRNGKLPSIDVPVARYLPELDQPGKRAITVRHLLSHTSGLEKERATADIYARSSFLQFALEARLTAEPGTRFEYNNRAMALLAAVVERAAGEPLDRYVMRAVFAPLGIQEYEWSRDEAGMPHAFAGLALRAQDLARIGEMMAAGGMYHGQRVVDDAWIDESTRRPLSRFPRMGLLWWIQPSSRVRLIDEVLVARWRAEGVSADLIERLAPLAGKRLEPQVFRNAVVAALGQGGLDVWQRETWNRGIPGCRDIVGPPVGFYAEGYLGQYLVVVPKAGLVAVRQVRERAPDEADEVAFPDFPSRVVALVE